MKRRALLFAAAGAALTAGCAQRPGVNERIVEVATGRSLSRAELLAAVRASEFALFGEQHDNPLHHRRRGELLAALPTRSLVVAEHLTRGRAYTEGAQLLPGLVAAGFDPQGWAWPLHEPLFAAATQARLRLVGGNLPRELARRIAREGEAALPEDLAERLRRAPLDAAAQEVLDADLVAGHCHRLPVARLPGMRLAQRARDAAMADALLTGGGTPAVLLAGNGHVRTDYGVPRLLMSRSVVSVGFVETGQVVAGSPYTHLWITPAIEREDPCADAAVPAALR